MHPDFQIDVDKADDVALMKVIQYRRQLMWHIDEGSEVPTWCTPKFLRQMSSGTAKAAAGAVAKTKQMSGEQFPAEAPPPRTAALIVAGLVAYPDSKYAKADSGGRAASSWGAPAGSDAEPPSH